MTQHFSHKSVNASQPVDADSEFWADLALNPDPEVPDPELFDEKTLTIRGVSEGPCHGDSLSAVSSLTALAVAVPAGSVRPQDPPHGKTGGSSRHLTLSVKENPDNTRDSEYLDLAISEADRAESGENPASFATNHPPLLDAGKKPRKSRAQETSPEMRGFMGWWFFDWCSLTIPNGLDGKGTRRRSPPDLRDRAEDAAGEAEAKAARDRLTKWCVSQGLRKISLRRGTDGFRAGMNFGTNPTSTERLATIRDGHATNMPAIEIPGGGGACAELAPSALALLGPVNAARLDVSWDYTRTGFFNELQAYAMDHAGQNAPTILDLGRGRTMTWDRGETMVKVYEKSMEQHAKGHLIGPPDPRKVRVEFRFMPKKAADKAGFARLARDEGPAGLLASVLWIRRMVEWIAAHTGVLDSPEAAVIGPSRLSRLPVARTIEDRARYGMQIGAPTNCMAAMDQIVRERHGGDWLAAKVDPKDVHALAVSRYSEWIINTRTHEYVVSSAGVDQARTIEVEAERNADELECWMRRQEDEDASAQARLADAHTRAVDEGVTGKVFDDEVDAAAAARIKDAAAEAVADSLDRIRDRLADDRAALDSYRQHVEDEVSYLARAATVYDPAIDAQYLAMIADRPSELHVPA